MAGLDFSTILAALGGTDKAAAESDPFAGLSDFGTSLAGTVLKTALPAGGPLTQYSPYATIPKYDIGGGIAAGLASGLLSGVADNLSEGYKTRQEDLAHQALTSVFSGNPLSRPDGMSPSVFSAVQKISDAQTISDTQEEADRTQKLADEQKLKASPAYDDLLTASPLLQEANFNIRTGKPLTEEMQKAIAGASIAERRQIGNTEYQNAINDRFNVNKTLDLSKEIGKSEPAKNYEGAKSFFDSLQSLQGQNTQSAAVAMVIAAAKIRDPHAVVRTGTYEIEAAPGSPALALQDYSSELRGTGQLSPLHQQQLIDSSLPFVQSAANAYKTHMDTQLSTYGNLGGDTSKIQTLPTNLGGNQAPASGGLPSVGGTFNGEKVLSVKRIR